MTDHKFTDDDVIKTLKNAKYKVDGVVTRGFYLSPETFNAVVDLIGRQEAEIERLQADINSTRVFLKAQRKESEREHKTQMEKLNQIKEQIPLALERAKAEAIKEFAQRLIDKCTDPHWCVWMSEIEDLVTEMTENKR